MARIDALPEYRIILGLRQVLDFACWRGQLYVRKWPRPIGKNRAPLVAAQWPASAYITQQWYNTSTDVQAAFNYLAQQTERTGRDYQMSAYYGKPITIEP